MPLTLTGRRIRLGKSATFDEYREQGRYMDKDQFVDFVLSFDVYRRRCEADRRPHDGVVRNDLVRAVIAGMVPAGGRPLRAE